MPHFYKHKKDVAAILGLVGIILVVVLIGLGVMELINWLS
jgi:hypothetical protein